MSEPIEPMGAWMRKQAEANGNCTSQAGALFLHLTRDGHDWALELNHEKPISSELAQHWAVECGAPGGTEFRKTAGGKVWRFTWQDEGDPAPDTVRAFYLSGRSPSER